jgi:PAS domain S-box-containing protein
MRKDVPEDADEAHLAYRRLVEQIPAITYTQVADATSPTGFRELYVSPQIELILGYSPDQWRNDPELRLQMTHPDDRERVRRDVTASAASGSVFRSEYRMVTSDGRIVWFRDESAPIVDLERGRTFWQGMMLNVTAEKEQEEALRANEERYRLVVENAQDLIAVFDLEGKLQYASPSGEQILGWSLDEMVGSTAVSMMTHPDDLETAASAIVRAVGGEPTWAQMRVRHKNGSWHYIEGVASAISDSDGHPVSVMLIARDITLRKAAEDAIARADTERRRFLSELVEAQEAERVRIAKDLSEDAIQLITALSIRLQALRRPVGRPQEADNLQRMAEAVDDAVIRLRRLLFELLPPALERDGLAAGLQQYLEVAADPDGRTWHVDNRLGAEPLSEIRLIAYRIVQEAVRSARSDVYRGETQVRLEERDNGLLVRIAPKDHDGNGFDKLFSEEALSSLDQRAQVAGGWCRVRHGADEGTVVELWLPAE